MYAKPRFETAIDNKIPHYKKKRDSHAKTKETR